MILIYFRTIFFLPIQIRTLLIISFPTFILIKIRTLLLILIFFIDPDHTFLIDSKLDLLFIMIQILLNYEHNPVRACPICKSNKSSTGTLPKIRKIIETSKVWIRNQKKNFRSGSCIQIQRIRVRLTNSDSVNFTVGYNSRKACLKYEAGDYRLDA